MSNSKWSKLMCLYRRVFPKLSKILQVEDNDYLFKYPYRRK